MLNTLVTDDPAPIDVRRSVAVAALVMVGPQDTNVTPFNGSPSQAGCAVAVPDSILAKEA